MPTSKIFPSSSSEFLINFFLLRRVLLRVRMLYYIKHEIIGDYVQQIQDGTPIRYRFLFLFSSFYCSHHDHKKNVSLSHAPFFIFDKLTNTFMSRAYDESFIRNRIHQSKFPSWSYALDIQLANHFRNLNRKKN